MRTRRLAARLSVIGTGSWGWAGQAASGDRSACAGCCLVQKDVPFLPGRWVLDPHPSQSRASSPPWHTGIPPSLHLSLRCRSRHRHSHTGRSSTAQAQRRGHPVSNPRGMSWHCSCLPGARLPDARGAGPGRPSRAHSCLVAAGQPVCARSAAMIGECIHGGLYFYADRRQRARAGEQPPAGPGDLISSASHLSW